VHRGGDDDGDLLDQRDPGVTGAGLAATAPRDRTGLRDQRGFTLIELLVVIIVLGLLVGLVGPRLFGRVGQSKQAAARAQIELLGAALDQFRLDIGRYPDSSQGLAALQQNPGNTQNWNGPYLKKAVPNDPWGNGYKYRCCPGQHGEYDLWSDGADGAPGGEGENADVVSWDSSTAQR
jgi:general secretion pathway protein G